MKKTGVGKMRHFSC